MGECPSGAGCFVFESVGQNGVPLNQGYCLSRCGEDSDCQSNLCDADLQACVSAALQYDLGSPRLQNDATCSPVVAEAAPAEGPFSTPTALTEAGEIYVFGPAVALDPVDPDIRYVAYNSLAGTELSVTHDAGATWTRNPMSPAGPRYNIGDPGLAVDSDTREAWHSFLTVPQVQCVVDETAEFANSVAITSSKDLGRTWSAPVPIDVGRYADRHFIDRPALAVRGGATSVTFVAVPADIDEPHTDVAFARSADGGATWATSTVNGSDRDVLRRAPAISVTPEDAVHLAWFEKDSVEAHRGAVWTARSIDGGKTFMEKKISGDLLAREDGPSLAWSERDQALFIVFGASVAGLAAEEVYLAASVDGGLTFAPPQRLAHLCGSAWSPTAVVDAAGNLWAIWYQAALGRSRVAWLKASEPLALDSSMVGVVSGSLSPFSMSRSPLVSLGDFVGLAASNGVTVAAWTSIYDDPLGGVIHTAANDAR